MHYSTLIYRSTVKLSQEQLYIHAVHFVSNSFIRFIVITVIDLHLLMRSKFTVVSKGRVQKKTEESVTFSALGWGGRRSEVTLLR